MKKSLFTLIELLIVIAIIAILASMLLPTLQKAKETAISVKCLSQLKQMGVLCYSYSGDFNEWAPALWQPNVGGWTSILTANNYLRSSSSEEKSYRCPDSKLKAGGAYGYRCEGQDYNGSGVKFASKVPGYHFGTSKNYREWKSYSEMIFMGDTLARYEKGVSGVEFSNHYRLDSTNVANAAQGMAHFRHKGKANILFGDGSARGIVPAELHDSRMQSASGGWNLGWGYYDHYNIKRGYY